MVNMIHERLFIPSNCSGDDEIALVSVSNFDQFTELSYDSWDEMRLFSSATPDLSSAARLSWEYSCIYKDIVLVLLVHCTSSLTEVYHCIFKFLQRVQCMFTVCKTCIKGMLSRYDRATTRVYWQFMSWLYFVITFKETIIVYMQ